MKDHIRELEKRQEIEQDNTRKIEDLMNAGVIDEDGEPINFNDTRMN